MLVAESTCGVLGGGSPVMGRQRWRGDGGEGVQVLMP